MNQSATIAKLAEALVKAQANIGVAVKDKTNPHFKSKYADLTAVSDACMSALNGHGIAVVQGAESVDGVVISINTTLMHTSGEWISASLALKPTKADPQGAGSAITYGRRYGLASMVGVTTDDDDGNGASRTPPPAQRETAKPTASTGARERFHTAAKKWTGLGNDTAAYGKALKDIAAKACVSVNGRAVTDDEYDTMHQWVCANAEQGIDFMEAIK